MSAAELPSVRNDRTCTGPQRELPRGETAEFLCRCVEYQPPIVGFKANSMSVLLNTKVVPKYSTVQSVETENHCGSEKYRRRELRCRWLTLVVSQALQPTVKTRKQAENPPGDWGGRLSPERSAKLLARFVR